MAQEVHETRDVRKFRWGRTVHDALLLAVLLLAVAVPSVAAQPAARREAEAAMLKADRGFNQAMAEGDMQRFLSYVAADATFNTERGREAVGKAWAPFFAADGPKISWTPTKAEALVGADIGYTVGTWERRTKAADGTTKITKGQYLTVWQKQKDGSWQATYDNGSTAP
jgi:ketosteroid isomerase-like protein